MVVALHPWMDGRGGTLALSPLLACLPACLVVDFCSHAAWWRATLWNGMPVISPLRVRGLHVVFSCGQVRRRSRR